MEQVFSLVLVGFTSVGAYLLATRMLGLAARDIRRAVGKMLECFGICLVFFVVNLSVGVIAVLVARATTWGFISLYMAADVTVLVLSVLQGLTFMWWRELSAPLPRIGSGD
ncbi:MAG: hypothetical protein ACE5JQ_03705 [Candidatus Methylomirabilales bacterium]